MTKFFGRTHVNYDFYAEEDSDAFQIPGLFVNRSTQEWYEINDPSFGQQPVKDGTVVFLGKHANSVSKSLQIKMGR